jgi:hypothetical protein
VGNLDYKPVTRRRRPHITAVDAILFLMFRLADSIPKGVVRFHRAKLNWLQNQIRQYQLNSSLESEKQLLELRGHLEELQQEWFIKTEEILHRAQHGPMWMSDPSSQRKWRRIYTGWTEMHIVSMHSQ